MSNIINIDDVKLDDLMSARKANINPACVSAKRRPLWDAKPVNASAETIRWLWLPSKRLNGV